MLYLSQANDFDQIADYSEAVINHAGGEKNLNEYRESINEFVVESNFERFWNDNIVFYGNVIDLTLRISHKVDWVKTLEDYYNQSQNSYNIILSPLSYSGTGPNLPADNGKEDLYNICPANGINRDGIHALNADNFANLTWHEFSHSFVNPLANKYSARFNKTSRLFRPVRKSMEKQYYRQWVGCYIEHIVRAVVVRLYSIHLGEDAGNKELQKQLGRDFIYIEPIVAKLKEYEKLRDEKNITFAEFFPEIVDVFESLNASK